MKASGRQTDKQAHKNNTSLYLVAHATSSNTEYKIPFELLFS